MFLYYFCDKVRLAYVFVCKLNDLAGDFFDEASFIGVDVRFFAAIVEQYKVTKKTKFGV
jgi:hypothetical protein